MKLSDLQQDPMNANKGSERGVYMLETSLERYGAGRSILVDKHGVIIAGNKTADAAASLGLEEIEVIESDGTKLIVVQRTDLDLSTDSAAKELAIADNRASEVSLAWDTEVLAELGEEIDLSAFFFEEELAELLQTVAEETQSERDEEESDGESEPRMTLAERFGVPPFSVLDARQGYWQARKREWLALGIQSELGRGEGVTWGDSLEVTEAGLNYYRNKNAAPGGSLRDAATLGKDGKTQRGDGVGRPISEGNGLLGESQQARSHYKKVETAERLTFGSQEIKTDEWLQAAQSGTSIFDPVLCELAYRWFCPEAGVILDPFAGGSVRGIVAARLGRQYLGIDLREEQVEANITQAQSICDTVQPAWKVGDSASLKDLADGQYDFVFSCPPYFDLEIYSEDPKDLSNLGDYTLFLDSYRWVIRQAVDLLKENRFACFVVGDLRDKKGFYRNFVGDTIAAFQDSGAILYNEAILVTAVGSLPIRVGKQFGSYRKLGKTHQNVLVFFKGDPKKIPGIYGECEYAIDLTESEESEEAEA